MLEFQGLAPKGEMMLYALCFLGYVFLCLFWFFSDKRGFRIKLKWYLGPKPVTYVGTLALILFLQGIFLSELSWSKTSFDNLFLGLGTVLYLAGALFAVWARLALGKSWGLPGQHDLRQQNELVTEGPFNYSRHPVYVGLIFMFLGFCLALRTYFIVFVLFVAFRFWSATLIEERLLEKYFGEKYRKYKNKVPRFL